MNPKNIIFDANSKSIRSVCSGCGNFFSTGDEVVICPIDDAPHHKDCWVEFKGCSKCGFVDDKPSRTQKTAEGSKGSNTLFVLTVALLAGFLLIIGIVIGLLYFFKGKGNNPVATPTVIVEISPSPTLDGISLTSESSIGLTSGTGIIVTETSITVTHSGLGVTETAISITSPSAILLPPFPPKSFPYVKSIKEALNKFTEIACESTPVPIPEDTVNPDELKPFETPTRVPTKKPSGKATKKPAGKPTKKPAVSIGNIQNEAVKIAMDQIGKPYIWETTGPDTFDCAGLCGYAYWTASGQKWNEWHIFYVSDMLKLCNIHRDFSEIRPGDLVVRNNYQYLKPFDVRNEEGPQYEVYDTHAAGWPYGESPVHDYGHIGMYVGEVTYGGIDYQNAVVEARGKDWGVVICELDRDGNGQMEWGKFFYRPKKIDN